MDTLGDIADVLNGYAFKSNAFSNYGIPVIKIKNMASGKIDLNEIDFYPEISIQLEKYKIEKGDILVSMTGSHITQRNSAVGKVTRYTLNSPSLLNQRVGKIVPKKDICDVNYLYYLTANDRTQEYWAGKAGGAANQANISPDIIKSLPIKKMLLETQRQIGKILLKYDLLIENNEKRIRTLEEMAQRLYAEWFVKFKFPGHEKVESINGLPSDWKYERIDQVAKVVRGTSYSSEQIDDNYGDYYLVNLKSFNRGGGFRFDGNKYFDGIIKSDQLLKQGDIVVAVTDMTTDRAVISRPARIPNINSNKITFSADVVKIIPEKLPFAYAYFSLLDYRFTETTKNKANGANVLHLKPQAISEYKVIVPTKDLLDIFEKACGNTVKLIDKLSEENEKLTKMRDLLIPQLITGKRELN